VAGFESVLQLNGTTPVFENAEDADAIREYFAAHEIRRLHLGSGSTRIEGWLHTDVEPTGAGCIKLDMTAPFPFPDGVFHYIVSEHSIEHIKYEDGKRALKECWRVLAPGGMLRISTPDLSLLAATLTAEFGQAQPVLSEYAAICGQAPEMATPAFLLNNEFRAWGHQFIYDESTLVRLLSEAGFSEIKRYPIGQSDDPALSGLETRDFVPVLKRINSAFTMVVQSRKCL
jgi:predicted SAM-dependent methyltransferase